MQSPSEAYEGTSIPMGNRCSPWCRSPSGAAAASPAPHGGGEACGSKLNIVRALRHFKIKITLRDANQLRHAAFQPNFRIWYLSATPPSIEPRPPRNVGIGIQERHEAQGEARACAHRAGDCQVRGQTREEAPEKGRGHRTTRSAASPGPGPGPAAAAAAADDDDTRRPERRAAAGAAKEEGEEKRRRPSRIRTAGFHARARSALLLRLRPSRRRRPLRKPQRRLPLPLPRRRRRQRRLPCLPCLRRHPHPLPHPLRRQRCLRPRQRRRGHHRAKSDPPPPRPIRSHLQS